MFKCNTAFKFLLSIRILLGAALALNTFSALADDGKKASPERKFNDVLNDLLDELSYDLKTNEVPDLRFVSIRKVSVSEAVPRTYEQYLESLTNERLRKFSKFKVIQCTNCRVRRSSVENNRVTISTPVNNMAELDTIARQLNVDTWLDIGLLYQETAMLYTVNAFDSRTKELIWSKVYNSESVYQKRALEGNGKPDGSEKPPSNNVYAVSLGYSLVPNVKTPANMMSLGLRFGEKFNESRSEVGAMATLVVDPVRVISTYDAVEGDPLASGEATKTSTTTSIKPFTYGLGLFAVYYHYFMDIPEDFDVIRYGGHTGFGMIVSKGYLAFTGRLGGIMKFGKRWGLEGGLLYSVPTSLTLSRNLTTTTKGGIGGEFSFNILL